MKKSPVISFRYFFHDFVKLTALPILLFFRPKKIYISKEAKTGFKGGFILASNHNGFSDPLYLQCCILSRRHHFVTTKEVVRKGFRRFWFRHVFLVIDIDRDNFSMSSFKEIITHLQKQEMVSMFPEGHINVGQEEINQFKSGIILMAYKANVPIRPVFLEKRKHWYSRVRLYVDKEFDVKEELRGRALNTNTVKELSLNLQNREKELESLCQSRNKRV